MSKPSIKYPKSDKEIKNRFFLWFSLTAIFSLMTIILLGYVAYHFISKYW